VSSADPEPARGGVSLRTQTIVGIIIAALFSLLYLCLYPMLTGDSVIYWYPPWSSAGAMAYIAGGILLQGGLCIYRWNDVTVWSLGAQVLAGLGYLVLTLITGEPYQS
jgi:hypothetical protein